MVSEISSVLRVLKSNSRLSHQISCQYQFKTSHLLLIAVRIQGNNICPVKIVSKVLTIFNKGKQLTLGERKESAMIIEQNWDHKTLSYIEPTCKFVVQTNDKAPGSGLYTVIKKLNFRKDNDTDTCIDYLIFSGGNRPNSKRICEKIGVKTGINDKESLIFNEHDHEVEIQVGSFISHLPSFLRT